MERFLLIAAVILFAEAVAAGKGFLRELKERERRAE